MFLNEWMPRCLAQAKAHKIYLIIEKKIKDGEFNVLKDVMRQSQIYQ